MSVILTLTKFLAYYLTNSNAILSDALESIINVLASGFAFYSIFLSAQPRDGNHPYGHGKIEYFSSGFEGALIIIAGIWIVVEAIGRLITPQPIDHLGWGGLLIFITLILNFILGKYLQQLGKKTRSEALFADGKHLITDSYSSIIILVAIVIIALTDMLWLDAVSSLLLSVVIFYNGLVLIRRAVAALMDETDPTILNHIVDIIKNHKKTEWIDVHNLRIQKYGSDLHIDCHLTLPFYWDLKQVHESVHEFEEIMIEKNTGNIEIFIHADPCLPDCCRYCKIDCPSRSTQFAVEMDWDTEKLSKNQKFFMED